MKRAGHIAVAVGVGYVLGRRRKLRAALLLGAAAATGQLGRVPGGRLLGGAHTEPAGEGSPGGAVARLGSAGRTAARSALSRPVDAFAERLNEKAEALRRGIGSGGDR
ncbi:hypothetical protein [Plantactinospora sp. GCM10030261]|uniref:hypothetical protein n=1 Tax=Plantactinospora sp. GCM10030261 TaxID=3273420 RepID=UPI00362199BF